VDTKQDTDVNLWGALLGLLITLGLAAAGLLLGIGVTGLAGETKSFWYISRAAGFVAYLLLWGSVVWGLLLSSKIGQGRLRPPALLDAHRFLSYVGLGFAFFHGLVLMGDRYLSFPLNAVLVPFASEYKPTLVAIGQLALWLSLLVSLSFLVQKRIGRRAWRSLHYASFAAYGLALTHSIWLGSESHLLAVKAMYLVTAEIVVFLTAYRIANRTGRKRMLAEEIAQVNPTN
jgi:DMSO/TMAO reductase YedYZ heme-binding membrane subunit